MQIVTTESTIFAWILCIGGTAYARRYEKSRVWREVATTRGEALFDSQIYMPYAGCDMCGG